MRKISTPCKNHCIRTMMIVHNHPGGYRPLVKTIVLELSESITLFQDRYRPLVKTIVLELQVLSTLQIGKKYIYFFTKKTYWGINWWLTSEFLESYKESDLREAVSDYGAYFMGLYYNKWYETKSLNKKDI